MPTTLFVGNGGHARSLMSWFYGPYQVLERHGTYPPADNAVIAFGGGSPSDLKQRWEVATEYASRYTMIDLIAPTASVLSNQGADVGRQIMHHTYIGPEVILDPLVIINTGAIVEHDAIIRFGAFVGPGAIILGNAVVGEGSFIGAGAIILPSCTVPPHSFVPAGTRYGV